MTHNLANRRLSTNGPQGSSRGVQQHGEQSLSNDNDGRNYKLIIDPALGQGKDKIIRYNGCMSGGESYSIIIVDPRPRISRFGLNRHNVNLKVPDFQIDQHYVGKILPKEVTFTNLNNNINQAFLQDMCKTFGDVKSVVIFYHPKTKKHLGLAKVVFSTSSAAQKCIEKLNQTSKMGNIISVFPDPSGEVRQKLLDELTTEKTIFRPPSPKGKLPANIMDETKNLPLAPLTAFKPNGFSKTSSPLASTTPTGLRNWSANGVDLLENGCHALDARCQGFGSSQAKSLESPGGFPPGKDSQSSFHRQQNNGVSQAESRRMGYSDDKHGVRGSCGNGRRQTPYWQQKSAEKNFPEAYVPANSQNGFVPQCLQNSRESVEFSRGFDGSWPAFAPPSSSKPDPGLQNSHFFNRSDSAVSLQHQHSKEAFRQQRSLSGIAFQNSQDSFRWQNSETLFGSQSSYDASCGSLESPASARPQESPQGEFGTKGSEEILRWQNSQNSLAKASSSESSGKPGCHRAKGDFVKRQNSVTNQKGLESTEQTNSERPNHPSDKYVKPDRLPNREQSTFTKSSSRNNDGRHSSKHSSHRHDSSRHRDRSRDSGHGHHHNRYRKHRSHHHSSSSTADNSEQSHDAPGVVRNDADVIPQDSQVIVLPGCLPSVDASPPAAESSPLHISLESRIQALLGQTEELHLKSAFNQMTFPVPPLPTELQPPPPLPVETEQPPLPPEPAPPDDAEGGGTAMCTAEAELESRLFQNYGERAQYLFNSRLRHPMSNSTPGIADLGFSDDQTAPSANSEITDPYAMDVRYQHYWFGYHPPLEIHGVLQMSLDASAYVGLPVDSGAVYGNLPPSNGAYGQLFPAFHMNALPSVEENERRMEERFLSVLKEVTTQLKRVIVKDIQKKMVENTGFKVYENWWKNEENKEETIHKPAVEGPKSGLDPKHLASVSQRTLSSAASTSDLLMLSTSLSSSTLNKPYDSSVVLSSLFDNNKDGIQPSVGGLGIFGGGLLGLRGVTAKMPSFRKKVPSPLPGKEREDAENDKDEEEDDEEEDDDDDEEEEEGIMTFRGPRTPEESENEEEFGGEEDSLSSSSLGDEDFDSRELLSKIRSSRAVVYSSSSSSEEDDEEEEEHEDEEEFEKDEEQESLGSHAGELTAESDLDVGRPEARHQESERVPKWGEYLPGSEDEVTKDRMDVSSEDIKERQIERANLTPSCEDFVVNDVDTSGPLPSRASTPGKRGFAKAVGSLPEMENKTNEVSTCEEEFSVEEEKGKEAVFPSDGTGDVSSLPTVQPSQLVLEWLSTLMLDHSYSLSPAMHSGKKGRKPRVNFSITDDPGDSELSDDTLSLSDTAIGLVPTLPSDIVLDHNYCQPYFPVSQPDVVSDSDGEPCDALISAVIVDGHGNVITTEEVPHIYMELDVVEQTEAEETTVPRKRKRLVDVTNTPGSRELANILPPVAKKPEFHKRSEKSETEILLEFLSKGLDAEDVSYIKRQYNELVQEDYPRTSWVNETHWVNHPPTSELSPPKKRQRLTRHAETAEHNHVTGSARTEGYYKISHHVKSRYLRHTRAVDDDEEDGDSQKQDVTLDLVKRKAQLSRDVRSESRRWQNLFATDLGDEIGDVLKFNKLEIRKKQLKFARSRIHDWGLFAMEPIAEGEMVIEYVGQVVRRSVADVLEKRYEAVGIGSSYLFRVDHDVIIDATKQGNLSRFVNHSCSPNCYAKIITVESEKKIVIYSKRDIQVNEEITYDYKFPLEEEKIPCLCGANGCRGTLN